MPAGSHHFNRDQLIQFYSVRDPSKWLASVRNHFGARENAMRQWIYGADHGAPAGARDSGEVYVRRFLEHERAVRECFAARPDDLLVVDVCGGGADWRSLATFCGVPDESPALQRILREGRPFPWSNKRRA